MPRALCPVLFALAATLGAAETVVNDVRVGIGMGPMPDEQEGATYVAPASISGRPATTVYEETPGLSVAIGGMWGRLAPVGLLVGFEVRSITGEMALKSWQHPDGTTYTADGLETLTGDKVPGMGFSQTGIAANLGIGWAVTSSVHVELIGIAGGDWTTLDNVASAGATDLTVMEGKGLGYTFGGRLGAYWTDPETNWQFGLEGEYTSTTTDFETSYLDVTIASDLENSGMAFRAVFGHRF
jgi:hypothetical protein